MPTKKNKSQNKKSIPKPKLQIEEDSRSFWTSSNNATWAGTVVATLGLIGALVFNGFALTEATNQRRASYQPDLAITHTLVKLKVTCVNNQADEKIEILTAQDPKHWSNESIKLQVINLGKGAARDIGYLWNAGTIEQLAKLKSYGIEQSSNPTELRYNGVAYPHYAPETIMNQDFVLTPDQGKFFEIYPSPYLAAELIFQTAAQIKKFGCINFSNHPALRGPILDIQYHDIERNYFHAEFETNYFPYDARTFDLNIDGSGTLILPYEIRLMSRGTRRHQAAWQESINGY